MTNPDAIAEALRLIAAGLPGVQEAHKGPLAMIPATPAAEVLIGDGQLAQFAGGGEALQEAHQLTVVFLEAAQPNVSSESETALADLATAFIAALTDPGFDDTLGLAPGIERTRPTAYSFGMTSRNGIAYRTAAIRVETGEL